MNQKYFQKTEVDYDGRPSNGPFYDVRGLLHENTSIKLIQQRNMLNWCISEAMARAALAPDGEEQHMRSWIRQA